MKPRIESFALGELVQDVVQKFRLNVEANQMTLQAKLGDDLPFVSADIGLIERVLENLIENALRYTPPGGRITVILSRMGENIVTRVTDTGCGIPPEELPHVFDRYHQVGNKHEKGAGLGLAITKRILELHGSTIEVQSALNQGTTFSFLLAIAQPRIMPVAISATDYSSHR
jgi:signal transduction histidine kinase